MCLAIPGRIVDITSGEGLAHTGTIDTEGVTREVNLAMVPGATVGDFVITHSGFALRVVPEDLLDISERRSPPGGET